MARARFTPQQGMLRKLRSSTSIACVLGLGLLLLGACQDNSPVLSGEVQAQGADTHPLSAGQVQLLNTWLDAHQSGWSGLVVATPPPTESLRVTVHRQSGQSGSITFYSQEGWKGALMYWGRDPKDNMQGSFPVEQVSELRQELLNPDVYKR